MSSTVLSSKSGLKPEIANPVEPLRPFFPTRLVVSLTAAAFSKLFLKSISKGEQVRRRPFMEAPSHRASALVAPWGVNELPSILQISLRRTEASVSLKTHSLKISIKRDPKRIQSWGLKLTAIKRQVCYPCWWWLDSEDNRQLPILPEMVSLPPCHNGAGWPLKYQYQCS